jgi:hypothetical protein
VKISSEPIGQFAARTALEQPAQFRLVPGVRIVRDPRLDDSNQLIII